MDHVDFRKHQEALCHQLTLFTNCDIHYSKIALQEREQLAHTWKAGDPNNRDIDAFILSTQDKERISLPTVVLQKMGVMIRGYDPNKGRGVKKHQISHADDKGGNWVVIIPITDRYTLNV